MAYYKLFPNSRYAARCSLLTLITKFNLFWGYQPRYLGDARLSIANIDPSADLSTPHLVSHQRKDKASSTPPRPQSSTQWCLEDENNVAPPLYPRKIFSQEFPPPYHPPPPLRPFNGSTGRDVSPPPHSAPFSSVIQGMLAYNLICRWWIFPVLKNENFFFLNFFSVRFFVNFVASKNFGCASFQIGRIFIKLKGRLAV